MSDLRTAAQQALEAMSSFESGTNGLYEGEFAEEISALRAALVEDAMQKFTDVNQELEAALAEPVLQTCNCRWDGEMQMQQCTLHEAHVDAIKEWAQRAKFAEKKLAALAEQRLTDVQQEMERSIESLKAALAEPVLNPAPGYCKHCKQYTIEEPLPAEPVQEQPVCDECGKHKRDGWALYCVKCVEPMFAPPQRPAESVQEPQCNPHPKAPHGFLRNASHNADRYVCECEYWDPYEAGYQAGMEAALKEQA